MFSGRMPPSIADGAVLLYGQRYDLERVLYAYAALIDALTVRFGVDRSYAAATGWPALPKPLAWPEPARHFVTEAWRTYGRGFNVIDSGVLHRIGPLEAKAQLLGRDLAWYDPAKRQLTMPDKRLVTDYARAEVRSEPHIDVYGLSRGGETFGMTPAQSESLRAMVLARQAKYGLIYTTSSFSRNGNDMEVVARISFPESIYGAGDDWLRVRCVTTAGTEVDAGGSGAN